MKIQNTTSGTLSIQIDMRSTTLPAGATAIFDDTHKGLADAERFAALGFIKIVTTAAVSTEAGSVNTPASRAIAATGQPSVADPFTVNGVVFEANSGGAVGAGHVAFTIGGSVAATYANLQTVINANAKTVATGVRVAGVITYGGTTTLTLVNPRAGAFVVASTLANATLAAVVPAVVLPSYERVTTVLTATGATQNFVTGLRTVAGVLATVKTSASVV